MSRFDGRRGPDRLPPAFISLLELAMSQCDGVVWTCRRPSAFLLARLGVFFFFFFFLC